MHSSVPSYVANELCQLLDFEARKY